MFAVCVVRDSDPGLNAGKAKPLYDLLVSFADVASRDTSQGYPYREVLAASLDCSKQTVDRAADYLETEVGLITVHRRKVEGKPDENDANLYELHDSWLIQGMAPPAGTPAQLVARYGHTVPGLDVDAWVREHAPGFDLAGWRAVHDEKLRAQEAKREEQRRKERVRRKKPKKGGGVTHDATPGGAASRGGSVMGDATGGVTHDATGGVVGDALSKDVVQEPSSRGTTAPSARSAGGVRSTSTSGSRSQGRSGSAAANKAESAEGSGKGLPGQRGEEKLSRKQLTAVRAVEALLPPLLAAQLPYGHIPTRNRPAVLEALESRTLDQLRDRIATRWAAYGYEPAIHHGELRSAVGAALELIAPTRHCPDLGCEDGTLIDTGEDCRVCTQRKEQRRADRLAGKAPAGGGKAAAAAVECLDCGHPFPGAVPADRLCKPCREAPAAAIAAFLAREHQEAQRRREAQELAEEAERRRARRASRTVTAVEDVDQEQATETEADARLRAELLADNPWMADYAQATPDAPAIPQLS
ncbi:hypothetical protein ACIP10_36185 [Streptomyces galbus]|uniref:hypothetical protein n=1 Tax=Streptomyces galbus TaxID=33898 RepID=UPI00379DD0F3